MQATYKIVWYLNIDTLHSNSDKFPPQTQYHIPTFIQLQFCVSSPHHCPSALHCIPASCGLSRIYLQGVRPFGIFILHCVASCHCQHFVFQRLAPFYLPHTDLVLLSCLQFGEPFPIVCASGTQLIYRQGCLRHFPSISGIIVFPRFRCTLVFYSAHGSNSAAFMDFTLSPRSSV